MLSPDYSKRDYLLPDGCKDLIDVLKLETIPFSTGPVGQPLGPMIPPKGDILVSDDTILGDFAAMLGEKPFKIIADAMQLGVFVNVKMRLPFEIMVQIAHNYGFKIRKRV